MKKQFWEKGNKEIFFFFFAFSVALLFACYTQHAWEDWYITFRASKNLAEGNGLTYNLGTRVHSFTSPINTLLPALFSFITFNQYDDLVLWLYRLTGCILLGIAAVLYYRTVLLLQFYKWAVALGLGMIFLDCKTVDFSINGMETAFLIVFLSLYLWLLVASKKKTALQLGLVWAGLQYTRPDAFLYIGAIGIGILLFNPSFQDRTQRIIWFKLFFQAGCVALLCYLPWLLWAWSYYGSPIPHTIIAKGTGYSPSLKYLVYEFITHFFDSKIAESIFLPPYSHVNATEPYSNWSFFAPMARWLSYAGLYYWLFPFALWRIGRVVSLAAFLLHAYLSHVVQFAFPWYYPPLTFLISCSLVFLLQDLMVWLTPSFQNKKNNIIVNNILLYSYKNIINIIGFFFVFTAYSFTFSLLLLSGYQLAYQQREIEDNHRKQMGVFLKSQAKSPNETVLLECLGYVGYFSQLKMYDWLGLCSPEVVAARRKAPNNWAYLVQTLQPDWLVLRPTESEDIIEKDSTLLTKKYDLVKVFDKVNAVRKPAFLLGRGYLTIDEKFLIYRLKE